MERVVKVVENLIRIIFLPIIVIGGIIVIGSMLWDSVSSIIGLWDMGLLWVGIGLITTVIIVVAFMDIRK